MASLVVKSSPQGLSNPSNARNASNILNIGRKFVPTSILVQHAQESVAVKSFAAHADPSKTARKPTIATRHSSDWSRETPLISTFTRLPRKHMTDKYFDNAGQLEKKGIWVRFRRVQAPTGRGRGTQPPNGIWQAKWKTSGVRGNQQVIEVEGRDEVDALIRDSGVGRGVFGLSVNMAFEADRVSWSVALEDSSEKKANAAIKVCVDTTIAKLEGLYGAEGTYERHLAGELEMSKELSELPLYETSDATKYHQTIESHKGLVYQLDDFVTGYPHLLDGESEPPDTREYVDNDRYCKADGPGRVAAMSEIARDRLMG